MIAHTTTTSYLVLASAGVVAVAVHAALVARWRATAAFGLGVAVVIIATSPTVDRAADRTFTGHMVQHLLLIVVAAPALAAGLAAARPTRLPLARRIRPTTDVALFGATVSFVAVVLATHLTPLYDAAIRMNLLHELEHAAYLATAVWLWFVIGWARRAGTPTRLLAVFAVIVGTATTGLVLLAASSPLVATYERRLGTADALADQRRAAALMWVATMLTVLPLGLLAVWRWASAEERVARHRERLEDAPGGRPAPSESFEAGHVRTVSCPADVPGQRSRASWGS
jgi:putative membrane protein